MFCELIVIGFDPVIHNISGGPPMVILEFPVVQREIYKPSIKRSLTYVQYSHNTYTVNNMSATNRLSCSLMNIKGCCVHKRETVVCWILLRKYLRTVQPQNAIE